MKHICILLYTASEYKTHTVIHGLMNTIIIKELFLQILLKILKHLHQKFQKILKKYLLGTIYASYILISSNNTFFLASYLYNIRQ